MPRRILIADDHFAVREGVQALLRDTWPNYDYAGVPNQPALMAALTASHWDLVLLDLTMPGRSGLEAVREIKDLSPSTAVLVYTMHPEDQLGVRALRSGADGFLNKERAPEELVSAVRRILEGKRYISDTLADRMAQFLAQPETGTAVDLLSDREYQILKLLGSGHMPTDIADQLHLSVKTVSTYRARVLEKLNLQTTADLIRYAIENKIT